MRFRFCGDLDCPDWLLAEINTLSKISSVKMKLMCVQVIKDLLGDHIDYEKVNKLTSDAKFETGDIQASIAALNFIISSAAKHNVIGDSLSNELQQLGLPKEHAGGLCKSYEENLDKLRTHFRETSLRLSQLESVQWRVDYILSSSLLKEVNEPCVNLKLNIKDVDKNTTEPVSFTMTSDKFSVFLHELKQASSIMENLATSSSQG